MASYTPPAGDAIDFALETGYVAPAGDSINFDLGDTGGSLAEIDLNLGLSSTVDAFSESYSTIDLALLVGGSLDVESGTNIVITSTFELDNVVDTFSQGVLDVIAGFGLSTRASIGVQSFVNPVAEFGLGASINSASVKPVEITSTFALSPDLEISAKGPAIDAIGLNLAFVSFVEATTPRATISLSLALENDISMVTFGDVIDISSQFAMTTNIKSNLLYNIDLSNAFRISTVIDLSTTSDGCSLPEHDISRWT